MKRFISFSRVAAAMVVLSAIMVAFGLVVMPAPTARALGLAIFTIGFPLLLFPYQPPPVVLAIQMGGLKPKAVVHFLFLMTLASILFLLPINFL